MLMPLGMTIMTRAAGPAADGPADGDPRRADAARPDPRPDPRRLADRARQLALDLPHQRADRHRRPGLRAASRCRRTTRSRPSRFDFLGMLLMSPGLALFLYGVSSIPARGRSVAPKVLVPMLIGLALMVAFVFHSFRPEAPAARPAAVQQPQPRASSTITMFLFARGVLRRPAAGARRTSSRSGASPRSSAGLLVAPQGIGAMLTMPIAGALVRPHSRRADRARSGWCSSPAACSRLTQIDADTSYWGCLIAVLFVMGLGMGGTMMPIMTSALKTLQPPRGRPRFDAAQHHPADRQLRRRRGHLGGPHEQPAGRARSRGPAIATLARPVLARRRRRTGGHRQGPCATPRTRSPAPTGSRRSSSR